MVAVGAISPILQMEKLRAKEAAPSVSQVVGGAFSRELVSGLSEEVGVGRSSYMSRGREEGCVCVYVCKCVHLVTRV